jgi:hypothetical protein
MVVKKLNYTVKATQILKMVYGNVSKKNKRYVSSCYYYDNLTLLTVYGVQIITFKRADAEEIEINEEEKKLMFSRVKAAYTFVNETLFLTGIPNGVHSLPEKVINKLILHLGIKKNDTFWEIGVGVPLLAFSLSAAAEGGTVIGTDIGEQLF